MTTRTHFTHWVELALFYDAKLDLAEMTHSNTAEMAGRYRGVRHARTRPPLQNH